MCVYETVAAVNVNRADVFWNACRNIAAMQDNIADVFWNAIEILLQYTML